jgi:putative endopeptidase
MGNEAPLIDGLGGDQRLFLGWAQRWRRKQRDEALRDQIVMDVHAPAAVRINAPLRNIDSWYTSFGVQPSDGSYLPPAQRVSIW